MKYKKDAFVRIKKLNAIDVIVQIVQVMTLVNDLRLTKDEDVKYEVIDRTGQTWNVLGKEIANQENIVFANTIDKFRELVKKHQDEDQFVAMPRDVSTKKVGLLLMRGDDRKPVEVFDKGFHLREDYALPVFKTVQGDALSESGICATNKPEFASLFPLQSGNKRPSWDPCYLYVLYAHNVFRTYWLQKQISEGALLISKKAQAYARYALNLAAREMIISEPVPGSAILGAYYVDRRWLGKDYPDGIQFRIADAFIENAKCKYGSDL